MCRDFILLHKSIKSDNNTEVSNDIKRPSNEIKSLNFFKDKCEKSEQQISDSIKKHSKLSELSNKHGFAPRPSQYQILVQKLMIAYKYNAGNC